MPTITRTTSGMIGPSTGEIQSRIDSLRSAFASGNTITAQHIYDLVWTFYYFNDHYHQTADLAFEAYGNTAPTGTFYESNPEDTSRMFNSAGQQGWDGGRGDFWEPGIPNSGDLITAAKHEEIRVFFDRANGHYHTIDDRVY